MPLAGNPADNSPESKAKLLLEQKQIVECGSHRQRACREERPVGVETREYMTLRLEHDQHSPIPLEEKADGGVSVIGLAEERQRRICGHALPR